MTRSRLSTVLALAVFFTASLLGSRGFAVWEQPPGSAPFGAAISSDAPGTKLNGVISMEFYGVHSGTLADGVRVDLRLSKGSQAPKVFFANIAPSGGLDFGSPTLIQTTILTTLQSDIRSAFGFPTTSTVKLKSLDENASQVFESNTIRVGIADIVLAVQ